MYTSAYRTKGEGDGTLSTLEKNTHSLRFSRQSVTAHPPPPGRSGGTQNDHFAFKKRLKKNSPAPVAPGLGGTLLLGGGVAPAPKSVGHFEKKKPFTQPPPGGGVSQGPSRVVWCDV